MFCCLTILFWMGLEFIHKYLIMLSSKFLWLLLIYALHSDDLINCYWKMNLMQGKICIHKGRWFFKMCTIGYDSCCFSYVAYLAIKFRSEQEMGRVGEVKSKVVPMRIIPYPTAFPYGNVMVLHFYQQQESSTTKTVHKVINKRLKTYV